MITGFASDFAALVCSSSGDASIWTDFQIREIASLRLVNLRTGVTPGSVFQILTRREVDHSVASLINWASLLNDSVALTGWKSLADEYIPIRWVSLSIVKSCIGFLLNAASASGH
jgi:hypothetical protein